MILLDDAEEEAIRNGEIRAIIRFCNASGTTFGVDGRVYKVVKRNRWSMRRCVARRCTDWGKDVREAKEMIDDLYGYEPETIVYLLVFKRERVQRSLV